LEFRDIQNFWKLNSRIFEKKSHRVFIVILRGTLIIKFRG